ncbi:Myb-like protein L isoform X1, partial [Tanacetum coccineum]
ILWELDEDKRLKIAANLFGGKSWNKVATIAPQHDRNAMPRKIIHLIWASELKKRI